MGGREIYGAIDAEIEVKEENGKRFFRVSKQRQLGTKEKTVGFALSVVKMGTDRWGADSSTCIVIPAEAEIKDTLETEKTTFIECCIDVGKLDYFDEKPFVSSSALARSIFNLGFAKSETASAQWVKPSAKGYLCNKMKLAGLIKHHGSGYLVLDTDLIFFIEQSIKGIKGI